MTGETHQALIFIPDISGFTRFMSETEISHSQHIIEELLEVILNENQIGLKLAEIEGDALFCYKPEEQPDPEKLARQCRSMFLGFHHHLNIIERDRICHCGACRTAINLTLKFVVHSGPVGLSRIGEQVKPVGKDVILAHRLMKNSIDDNEYVLMTKSFTATEQDDSIKKHFYWADLKDGCMTYEHIGEVDYRYVSLTRLKNELPSVQSKPDPPKFKNPIVKKDIIEAPMSFVYDTILDLGLRTRWTEGLEAVDYDETEVQRLGSKHICRLPTGEVELESIQHEESPEQISYAERANKNILLPGATTFYTLRRSGEDTLISVAFHYKHTPVLTRIINLFLRKKLDDNLQRSLAHLKQLCEKEKPDHEASEIQITEQKQ